MRLTKKEFKVLTAFKLLGFKYIARDEDETLIVFMNKPHKEFSLNMDEYIWDVNEEKRTNNEIFCCYGQRINYDLFKGIKPIECYKIEELLGGE